MQTIMVTTFTRDWAATVKDVSRCGIVPILIMEAPPVCDFLRMTPERSCLLAHSYALTDAGEWDSGGVVIEDDVEASWHWDVQLAMMMGLPCKQDEGAIALYVPDFCRARCKSINGSQLEQYDHTRFVGTQAIWWGKTLAAKVGAWLLAYDAGGGRLPVDDALRLCPHLQDHLFATPIDLFDHKPGPSLIPSSRGVSKAGRFAKGSP